MTRVWYVQGDEDNFLFATKMDAEIHARILYPDEDPDRRYARVYFHTVHKYAFTPEQLEMREAS